jgi:hypothetical protein
VYDTRLVGADRRVRRRVCPECGTRFATVEKVFDPTHENAISQQERQSLMDQLSDFLNYARDRITDGDESLPASPEDCAAVMGFLCALVPEYELDQQAGAADGAARLADRKQAIVAGLRRGRGTKPAAIDNSGDGNPPEAA